MKTWISEMPASFAARPSYFTFITRRSFTHDFTCISSPSSQMGGHFFCSLLAITVTVKKIWQAWQVSPLQPGNGEQGGCNFWSQLLKVFFFSFNFFFCLFSFILLFNEKGLSETFLQSSQFMVIMHHSPRIPMCQYIPASLFSLFLLCVLISPSYKRRYLEDPLAE